MVEKCHEDGCCKNAEYKLEKKYYDDESWKLCEKHLKAVFKEIFNYGFYREIRVKKI